MSYEPGHESEPEVNQESSPGEPAPQESFGPDFPQGEQGEPKPSYASPDFYRDIPPPQPAYYGAPQPPPQAQAYGAAAPLYGYGVPQQMPPPYGYGVLAEQPLPFWQAVRQLPRQYWRVCTRPNARTFVEEQGKASWGIVWFQILALAIVSTLIYVLLINLLMSIFMNIFQQSLQQGLQQGGGSSIDVNQFLQIYRTILQIVAFSPIITVPLYFFIGVGLNHLIAKGFGGIGTFRAYSYCFTLFNIPITFMTILLSFIPFVGYLALLAGLIYQIVLQVHMTMGVHRLSGGRATGASLILPIIGVVLFIGAAVAYVILLMSVLQHMR